MTFVVFLPESHELLYVQVYSQSRKNSSKIVAIGSVAELLELFRIVIVVVRF